MKRLFALLALVGAVALGAPAWADDKAAHAGSNGRHGKRRGSRRRYRCGCTGCYPDPAQQG